MTVMLCERTCEVCGATYQKRPSDSYKNFGMRRFCSPVCSRQAGAEGRRAKGAAETEYMHGEVEHLLDYGSECGERIATRLGFTYLETLADKMTRTGRPDLAQRLRERSFDRPEPCPRCGNLTLQSGMKRHLEEVCGGRWGHV